MSKALNLTQNHKLLSLLSPMAIALREELGNDQDSQVFIDA
jgi:hypothetical protein